jgi:TonB family protein
MIGRMRRPPAGLPLLVLLLGPSACRERAESPPQSMAVWQSGSTPPDELPTMLNREPPFHYPRALYERRVQGNVTLRLFVDAGGAVRPESTSVAETSGYPPLDSAAVEGARALRFRPARQDGRPLAAAILFPVYFRHPRAAPLPGDTVLKQQGLGSGVGGRRSRTP